MANNIRKSLAMLTVLCVFIGMAAPQALAAETTTSTDQQITTDGGITTTVTTTTQTTVDGDTTTVVVTIQTDKTGIDENGVEINYTDTRTETTSVVNEANGGATITETWTDDGSESARETIPTENVTVTVPNEAGEENSVTVGDPAGTVTTNPDGSTTTVEQQGSVTVGTTDVEFSQTIDSENTDMEYVVSDTVPTDDNDLVYVGQADEMYLPGYEGEITAPAGSADDNYGYTYVGSGNTSMYVPAIVYTEPLDEEGKLDMYGENAYIKSNGITWYYVGWLPEDVKATIAYDENGKYVTDAEGYILDVDGNRIFKEERTSVDPDGNTVYLHRFDNYGSSMYVEGWYEDGE